MSTQTSNKDIKAPQSVGIIMDGNRRWAKGNSLKTLMGHSAGYKKAKEVAEWARILGVKTLILYTFSIENWKRDPEEVSYLMKIIESIAIKETKTFIKNNTKVLVIGDKTLLSKKTLAALEKIESETGKCTGMNLILAISYGGRSEILNAIKKISEEKSKEEIKNITESEFEKFLWTKDVPDPDLIIRTSGEMRLSNFLPWQSVYSELFFTKTLWPDFSQKEFISILNDFSKRQRRHGK